MKTKVLTTAATLVMSATLLGVGVALFGTDPQMMARLSTVAGILALGSVGLFFVGLAFPKGDQK